MQASVDDNEQDRVKRDALWRVLVEDVQQQLSLLEAEGKLQRARLDEPLSNELIATAENAFLSVWLHVEVGSGSWNQVAPVDQCEPWSLGSDGVALLSGSRLNIHELARAFASKLVDLHQ